MSVILDLPKPKSPDLIFALRACLEPAIRKRNILYCGWKITEEFMNGARGFRITDAEQGEVDISYEDEDGFVHLRWDWPMVAIQREIGRLSKLDISPQVMKKFHSLESLRNSATHQAALNFMFGGLNQSKLKKAFITHLVLYGTAGIAAWPEDRGDSPFLKEEEVIHPCELLCIPSDASSPSSVRAIARSRPFPYLQLKQLKGITLPKNEAELGIRDYAYGETPDKTGDANSPYTGFESWPKTSGFASQENKKPKPDKEGTVWLTEFWILRPDESIDRYIVRAGDAVIKDVTTESGDRKPFPIGIGRYYDTGGFYGRSFAGTVIPFSLEMERYIEKSLEHSSDMDRFGITFIPNSWRVNLSEMQAPYEGGPRFTFYEPDYAPELNRVQQISPMTATDAPLKALQFGIGLLNEIASQGEMYGGATPGSRVDSPTTVQSIERLGSTHLIPVADSIRDAFTTIYRSSLRNVRDRIQQLGLINLSLDLTRLENTIAGITLDPETGKLSLDADAFPDEWGTEISIKSTDPIAGDRERTEAGQMLTAGILPPDEFVIANYKKGWNYPVGQRYKYESYVKACLYNLILFNDGEIPGTIRGKQLEIIGFADLPSIHLLAIQEFTSGSEFALASDKVRAAFNARVKMLMEKQGGSLPDNAPALESIGQQQEGNGYA